MKDAISNSAAWQRMLERLVMGAAHYSNGGKSSAHQGNGPLRGIPDMYEKKHKI
jgi:hypothetical protein